MQPLGLLAAVETRKSGIFSRPFMGKGRTLHLNCLTLKIRGRKTTQELLLSGSLCGLVALQNPLCSDIRNQGARPLLLFNLFLSHREYHSDSLERGDQQP